MNAYKHGNGWLYEIAIDSRSSISLPAPVSLYFNSDTAASNYDAQTPPAKPARKKPGRKPKPKPE